MSGNENVHPDPLSGGGTSNQLKKSIGKIIIDLNSEILELQAEYKKVKPGTSLSTKGVKIEKAVKDKKAALEEAVKGLEARQDFVIKEKMEKTTAMIKDNIATANKVLDGVRKGEEVSESEIADAKKEALEAVEEVDNMEKQAEEEMLVLTANLSSLATAQDLTTEEVTEDEEIARELRNIDPYHATRFKKMKSEIESKMDFHKEDLKKKWQDQKDILDYQALKEIRNEFESTHKKMRFMVNEWDKRKLSDRLADHLMDQIDIKFDEYINEFRRMDEEKRTDAAVLRKRNLEMEDYKREKRRAIPSWPKSLPYSKFKPDLLSWDKEHYLSSGSVKFGLLAEMMKNQDRITTYEQIQTRLGKNRNDSNIINQVVALLDSINEETVYNKLCTAWGSITGLKKTKEETLNDFFSKFETLQYSLNLADDTYEELEPVKEGKDLKYYEERDKMASRKVELNDKLKAVHLIKALGVDGAHKRDILSKVDFNKEPKQVYEDTKTAIRDICGDEKKEIANQEDNKVKKESDVFVVKPWQDRHHDRSRERSRFSRSRSGDKRRGSRSRDRRDRNYSRERFSSKDRSSSRGRSKDKPPVAFQERRGRTFRRDSTPGTGMASITLCSHPYDRIYKTDEFFRINTTELGQFMIVDCGCPRSLMGIREYQSLKMQFETISENVVEEKFRFGPSRIFDAKTKVKLLLKLGESSMEVEFFVVNGNIPILLGNDAMEPLDASIDMEKKSLKLKKIQEEIPMIKTTGGHFVVPLKNVLDPKSTEPNEASAINIKGEEAEAVMTVLLASLDTEEDLEKFHSEVGHSIFVTLAMEKDEKAQVMKVHKYFGHRSGRRIWELFAKAGKLKGKKKAAIELIDKCKICTNFKKAPPRPKVGLSVANDFNEIVGLDLKVLNKAKGEYILWMVDIFSKLIKGKFIKDKNPSTIIEGIISSWIVGDGVGPGHPRRGFWSDNGGEFLNNEVIDFAAALNVQIKMTAANAPWQNGIVERHHATADVIFEKMMLENPSMSPQEAVNYAAFAKNSEINHTRFSALQLMMGQNPHFPGLAEANPASSNLKSSSKYLKTLKNIDESRVLFREMDSNEKLKKVMGQKINPNVEKPYSMGDSIFFYDEKKKEWKKGTALVRLGKTLYLRFGNFLRRVPIDKVRPDFDGEVSKEEGYVEPNDDEERFAAEETAVEEMAAEVDLAEENNKLKKAVEDLQNIVNEKQNQDATKHGDDDQHLDDVTKDQESDVCERKKEIHGVVEKRKLKRQRQKEKKNQEAVNFPKLSQRILFKENDSDEWKSARVIKAFKKTSKYKNFRHLELKDGGIVEKDFVTGIEEWKAEPEEVDDVEIADTYFLSDILGKEDAMLEDVAFPVKILPRKEYNRPEIQEAMQAEIAKFVSFDAFKEVSDDGQYSIPIRWVVTEQKLDGKNQPFKARLCIRGDKEEGKEHIRADSPTASKESLKIALIVAANEGFKVKSGDIKSAFLQGSKLEREIFVKPPPEANSEGKLWQLLQGAYGILDGGRLFYLKLAEKLQELGLHKVHSDGALFTYVKNGKLQGLITTHVDDLIMAGNETFATEVEDKLQEVFKFSKVEQEAFTYCGCSIVAKEDGTIELDQNDYIDALGQMDRVEGEDSRELSDKEKKEARGKIGALLWISLMTRPDLSFDVNILSSEVSKGSVKTVKEINRVVRKAKNTRSKLRFARLGDISELLVKVYADASFANQDQATRSTGGRVVLLENKEENTVNIASWKTKKIGRVCRSVKGAETRALEEAIDEAVHTARIVNEIYIGKIDLKNPAQIPVEALTDSKSLWESVHNTRQCEEKLLRNSIAGIKEMMELGMVKSIEWVPTDKQLADCMTKKGKKAEWLLRVASENTLGLN